MRIDATAPAMTDDSTAPTVDADAGEATGSRRGDTGRRSANAVEAENGYAAVVFDMDGTLVEFTGRELRRETAVEAFDEAGIAPTDAEMAAVVDGSTANARAVCRDRGVDPAAFYDPFDRLLAKRQRAVIADGGKPPYEDALAALEGLSGVTTTRAERADGGDRPAVGTAVVSNNYQSVVDSVVERHFPDRFAVAYGTDPGDEGRRRRKPDPHFLLRALEDLAVDPGAALMVGDSADDVDAAAAAGADVALLARGRGRSEPAAEPTYRLDGLDELVDVVTGDRSS